jgi:hypothetical protein
MGLTYMWIEMLFRSRTYLAIGVIGSIDGVLIGLINEEIHKKIMLTYKIIVTIMKFIKFKVAKI